MCVGTVLTVASTLIGAVGAIQQANAASAAASYNAQVGEMNARISDKRAQDAIDRGMDEEQQKRLDVAQIRGRQEAAMAANNVSVGFGSSLDTLVDSKTAGELDALTIRYNSEQEAYDNRVQAANQRADAQLNRMEAKSRRTAGYINAFGTVLGGASKAFSGYQKSRGIGAIS